MRDQEKGLPQLLPRVSTVRYVPARIPCVLRLTRLAVPVQTNPHALADRTQAQSNAFFATHCMGGHKHSYCSQATQ